MKRPTKKEIFERLKKSPSINASDFEAGIDFVLKYNEEQRDILKLYYIGFEVDVVEIHRILKEDNDLWDEYDPHNFVKIADVHKTGNSLRIDFHMRTDYGLHEDMNIKIDDKGRVYVDLSDTPYEGSGVEDELEEAIMSYVTKQKYK